MSDGHIYVLKWLALLLVGFGCIVGFHAYVMVQMDLKHRNEKDE